MGPIKALRRLREAQELDSGPVPVTIVLPTGKVIRGRIIHVEANRDTLGALGEMVGVRTQVELRVDLGS